ncbi:MAG: twin-arginine translocase TatA/TatE family subunit [Acidimicrobiia bacterium]
MNLGPAEIIVVFVVALLVFGPKKLPELSRQIGRGMKELRSFQQTLKGELDDMMVDVTPDDSTTATPVTDIPPDGPGRKALDEPAGEGSAPTLDDSDDAPTGDGGGVPGADTGDLATSDTTDQAD